MFQPFGLGRYFYAGIHVSAPIQGLQMDFDMLGLAPRLIAELKRQGIVDPTPIQAQAIPHAMNGRDVMGLAQTGSGKTAAFGLPMIDMLLKEQGKPEAKTARALILAPTRELAKQIQENLAAYTTGTHQAKSASLNAALICWSRHPVV
jgi:superfamily II DNA/RNA helicase